MPKIDRDAVIRMGLSHGVQAPAMIEKGWGREIAATWLGGLVAGIATSAETMLGTRGAYNLIQTCADRLAERCIEASPETAPK